MSEIQVSVDKLTVIGNLYLEAEDQLQHLLNQEHVKILGTPYVSAVKAQLYDGLVYIEYDKMMGEAFKRGNMRIEYNPSKMPKETMQDLVSSFKPMLHDVHFSRVDLAFDVEFDLTKYHHMHNSPMKFTTIHGVDGKIETLYYGSRNSDFYSRTYNKKKQLLEVEGVEIDQAHLWRYELEIKNRRTIQNFMQADFPVFDRVRFVQYDFERLGGIEQCVCVAVIDHPELMAELGKNTKTKYKKMIRESVSEDITPNFEKALKKNLPQIKRSLEIWERIPTLHEIMRRSAEDYR